MSDLNDLASMVQGRVIKKTKMFVSPKKRRTARSVQKGMKLATPSKQSTMYFPTENTGDISQLKSALDFTATPRQFGHDKLN